MGRLIDADALLEDARKNSMIAFFGSARMCDIQKLIDRQPTVDAVPVVRCTDCIYWDKSKKNDLGICKPPNKSIGGYCTRRGATEPTDYCCQAVRGESKYKRKKEEKEKET